MTAGRSLIVERSGGVAIIRLNRPAVLNALSPELVRELLAAVVAAGRDGEAGSVMLAGEGRSFCAGGDLTAMLSMDRAAFRTYIELLQDLARAFHDLPIPLIAAVHGHVLAGGFELALGCDIRIAADDAVFGLPDTALGLSPTSGMTWLLPRVVGAGWARHLLLTGETIDAPSAARIGLVTRVVPCTMLEDEARAVARLVAGHPPLGVAGIRSGLRVAGGGGFEEALVAELEAELACFDTDAFGDALRAFASRTRRNDTGG